MDNVEHIYRRTDPNYTNYEVTVSFSDTDKRVETAATQRYGLAWNISNKKEDNSVFWYDLNADGIVNELDFTILANNMISSLQSPESYIMGDLNNNGEIDVNDVEIFIRHKNAKADWLTKAEPK